MVHPARDLAARPLMELAKEKFPEWEPERIVQDCDAIPSVQVSRYFDSVTEAVVSLENVFLRCMDAENAFGLQRYEIGRVLNLPESWKV